MRRDGIEIHEYGYREQRRLQRRRDRILTLGFALVLGLPIVWVFVR